MTQRILIFATQNDANQASAKITTNMGLTGSSYIWGIPQALADGRWFLIYPSQSQWVVGVQGFTEAAGTGLVAVGEAAPTYVPPTITNYQARAQLHAMATVTPSAPVGRTLLDDVNNVIAAQGGLAGQAWEYANDLSRQSPLVLSLASSLGLTTTQMDQFFIAASAISA